MTDGPPQDVTAVLSAAGAGDAQAADRLMPLVYDELRELARRAMARERPDHTLQATALVNEAYMRMVDQTRVQWRDRNHFYAVAATMIRRILVNHARDKNAAKRGGDWTRIALADAVALDKDRDIDLIALDEALNELHNLSERQARVVELRFFAGLTIEEAAGALDVSTTTVENDWAVARAWLRPKVLGDQP